MFENMDNSLYKNITLNYKHIIIDEIALEGLEGIGIDLLWRRVEKRISTSLTEKMKKRYWSFVVNVKNISFYTLPEPVPHMEIVDRFQIVDGELDTLRDPETCLDGPYEYQPIENEYGSCVSYHTRKPISNSELCSLSYDEVVSQYGPYLVLVASLEYRWQAIASHQCISYLQQLSPVHYCILELIGRSRENGQMTIGNTNLQKIVKDSKLLFYNRKVLQDMDLIRTSFVTQKVGERGVKSILLRLKRFHQRAILTMPKVGKLHSLINYLKDKPEYSERTDTIVKKGFLTRIQNKKLQKASKVFEFGDKIEHIESNLGPNKKQKVPLKRRHISLSMKSDESSQSEEETEPPLKCQYKVGMNLLRQAYEMFLDAGLKGLTQLELGKLIGAEFYTTRNICRFLKTKNIVREILEDVGRQRTARYIAVAAGKTVSNYDVEKKKFLEYLNQGNNTETVKPETPSSVLENNQNLVTNTVYKVSTGDGDVDVIEVKTLDSLGNIDKTSLFNSKKSLTLRQLRYANGILKILNDKQIICGYQPLSNLVAKEIGEAPMDTKALKLFIQKLIMDGQIKVYKLKSPGSEPKYTVIMCPAHVTPNSLIIRAKCRDVAVRAKHNRETNNRTRNSVDPKLLTRYAYPRYIKVRKLHEFIVKLAYFVDSKNENIRNVPRGCLYLADIIPEMSVALALGNVSDFGALNIEDSSELQAALKMKLRDAPQHVIYPITSSNSFHNALRGNLRLLALFGLIQVIDQPLTLAFGGIAFHVNLHAKIVDTTGKWPRPDADVKNLERNFYFESMNDVYEFWDIVYQISCNTIITVEKRMKSKLKPTVRQRDEVLSLDIGDIPGDGNGPCGFDSGFYLDLPRLWRSLNVKLTKSLPKPIIKSVKNPIPKLKIRRRLKVIKSEKKKTTYQPPKAIVNESRVPKARGKRTSDIIGKWSKTEDLVISLCKAAITVISPSSQPGCLSLRNITARDILSQIDPKKTQKKCHKRALMLESDSNRAYERDCLLNEFRRKRNLAQKYTGLLKQLRIRYSTNITKCVNEARLPMLELIWIFYKIIQSKSYMKNTPCIAMNLESFHKNFIIRPTSVHRPYNAYKGQNDSGSIATLKEIIILTVAMSHKQVLPLNIAQKIYNVFKSYPEIVLRKAIDELRRSQAITEKNWTSKTAKMNLQDLVECSYKFSAGYYRRWISKLNASFFDEVSEALEREFPIDDVKGTPSLNCLASELQACGSVEIMTSVIPSFAGISIAQDSIQEEHLNVIDIETKYRFKSGSLSVKSKGGINKSVELFRNINAANMLAALSRQAEVTYPDNESIDAEDVIVMHLENQREEGSTYQEVQKHTNLDTKILYKRLNDLESKHVIKRVGYYDNRVILVKYIKPWTMTVDDKTFIPSPWLTINVTIQLEIFLKWVDSTISKVFESPGCSIAYLTDNFELITSKSIQDICIFLQSCKCITMKVIPHETVDLFSEDIEPELLDYNEYESPSNIYIFLEKNVITTYAYIKKQLMNECLVKHDDVMSD